MELKLSQAELAIVGGTVVTGDWMGSATVLINGGQIIGLVDGDETGAGSGAGRVINASGHFVMPGGVDPHCHVANRHGEFRTLDDFESASRAALLGGTTTIVDFAIPSGGQSPMEALQVKLELGKASRCDYALHGCIVGAEPDPEGVVRQLAESGVRTVKLYTTYRNEVMVSMDTIERVMKALKQYDGLVYIHAESNDLIEAAQAEAANRGAVSASSMHETRPAAAEEDAVSEILKMAERTGAPVYLVHQSAPGAVDLVVTARQRGVAAYAESCPHYLTLDESQYGGEHPERFVCCPPLRNCESVQELVRRLEQGFIDTIGSDHCCYDAAQKVEQAHDVRFMPNGMPGVETRLEVVWDAFVNQGRLSPTRFVQLTAANPARLSGLYPHKGSLAPGSDADIVIFDPARSRTLRAAELHMDTDYTPFEGRTVTGCTRTVLAGGVVVVEGGSFLDPGPVGRFLESAPIVVSAGR